MKKKIVTKICSIALAGFIAVSSIPVSEAYATEIENVEDNNQEEQGTDAADDTKSAEKNQGVQEENKDDSENADNGDEAKDAGNDKTKDAAEETTEGTENTEATEETEKTEETETTEAAETEDTEATEETDNQENTEDTTNKDNVSTEGIDKAFQVMDINSMFSKGELTISDGSKVTAEYNKAADGLLVSGSKADMAGTVFTFAKEFDFSSGVVGRIDIDALAVKGNKIALDFYVDDNTTPVASIELCRQKRDKKWYSKNLATSIYDKKLTGKHKISFKVNQKDSEKTAGVVLRKITFVKTTIPVMYFDIDESEGTISSMNSDTSHDTECYGKVKIEVPDGYECEYGNEGVKTETYDLDYIRGRGNSTWWADKKPYKLKFDKKQNLFNMGKNKHWVLLADYYDPSHIRNKFTYWAGKNLDMDYTPECVYVDVVMNGEYYGSYLLSEQIRLDKNRVDLDNLEEETEPLEEPVITGGYLLGLEPYGDETDLSFMTTRGNSFLIESPSFEEFEDENAYAPLYNYISKYVQDTEDAIYGEDFKDAKGNSYDTYLDVDSAVKYWWMQDVSSNGDAMGSTSSYMYKERNGKLYYGPIWDFDFVAWGNNQFFEEEDAEYYDDLGWYYGQGFQVNNSQWYKKLFEDPEFANKIIKHWPNVKNVLTEAAKDGGQIDKYASEILYSMYYNNKVYGNNYTEEYNKYTFQDSVSQLKQWINKRIQWVDENLNQLEVKYYTAKFYNGKTLIDEKTYRQGYKVAFPEVPSKKGYVFAGWQVKFIDEETGKEVAVDVSPSYEIYSDDVFYAKWVKESKVVPVKQIILGYDNYKAKYYSEDFFEDENYLYIPYKLIGGDNVFSAIKWKTSDENILVPTSDGQFKIVGSGDVVVTAYSAANSKIKAQCKVHVVSFDDDDEGDDDDYIYDFNLNKKNVTLNYGDYAVITATPTPDTATGLQMNWQTENYELDYGQVGNKLVIKGNKAGKYQFVAVGLNENDALIGAKVIDITVNKKPIAVKDTIRKSGIKYSVLSVKGKKGTVKVTGLSDSKLKKVTIPSSIKIDNQTFDVVSIGDTAFNKNTKITSVTIGKNVSKIGKSSFSGAKNLKTIVINSTKLKDSKVGASAFKGINKKAVIKVPKKYLAKYKKFLTKKGISKYTTIKAI